MSVNMAGQGTYHDMQCKGLPAYSSCMVGLCQADSDKSRQTLCMAPLKTWLTQLTGLASSGSCSAPELCGCKGPTGIAACPPPSALYWPSPSALYWPSPSALYWRCLLSTTLSNRERCLGCTATPWYSWALPCWIRPHRFSCSSILKPAHRCRTS